MFSGLFGSLSKPTEEACQEVLRNCKSILFSKESNLIAKAALEECKRGLEQCSSLWINTYGPAVIAGIVIGVSCCCCISITCSVFCCIMDCVTAPCRRFNL